MYQMYVQGHVFLSIYCSSSKQTRNANGHTAASPPGSVDTIALVLNRVRRYAGYVTLQNPLP